MSWLLLLLAAGDAKVQILTSDSSVAAKNVTAGLEDSGVEVGQESEQENTPRKAEKPAVDAGDSVDDLPDNKQKQVKDLPEPAGRNTTEQIVFAGNSIDEPENEKTKNKPAR